MQIAKWAALTPACILCEDTSKDGSDADTNSQGTHDNALKHRHLVKANDVRNDGERALQKSGSAEAENGAAQDQNSRRRRCGTYRRANWNFTVSGI